MENMCHVAWTTPDPENAIQSAARTSKLIEQTTKFSTALNLQLTSELHHFHLIHVDGGPCQPSSLKHKFNHGKNLQRFRFYFCKFDEEIGRTWWKFKIKNGIKKKQRENIANEAIKIENETKVRTGVEEILSNDNHYHVHGKCHVCERIMKCNHLLNGIINEFRARSITWTSGREINPGPDDDGQEK